MPSDSDSTFTSRVNLHKTSTSTIQMTTTNNPTFFADFCFNVPESFLFKTPSEHKASQTTLAPTSADAECQSSSLGRSVDQLLLLTSAEQFTTVDDLLYTHLTRLKLKSSKDGQTISCYTTTKVFFFLLHPF